MAAKNRQCPISWPTRRLLLALVLNEHDEETAHFRDGRSSPGGVVPTTLAAAQDSVQQGYEPYEGFPAAFVVEELKLLQKQYGKKYTCAELLTNRDWKAQAKCNSSGPGEPALVVQVDDDVADFLWKVAGCNGIDLDGYANQLLAIPVLDELGRGDMILNRSQSIGGIHVDRGTMVQADPVASDLHKRHVTVKVGRKTVEGLLDIADLLRPDRAAQDRALILQRVKQALASLNVAIHPLAGEGEVGSHMVRVACDPHDQPKLKKVKRHLKGAGLVAYNVKFYPGELHVRAND